MTTVVRVPGQLSKEEVETSLVFSLASGGKVEFQTGVESEIKRLQKMGYEPDVINVFESGRRIALFSLPKSLYRFPFSKGPSTETRAAMRKRAAARGFGATPPPYAPPRQRANQKAAR